MHRENLCNIHEERLKLFCKEEHRALCLVCHTSSEHENHQVRPIEDSAREYKNELEKLSDDVKKGCRILRQKLKQAETAMLQQIEKTNMKRCNLEKEDLSTLPDRISPFIQLIKEIEEGCKPSAGEFLKAVDDMGKMCTTLKSKIQSPAPECTEGAVLASPASNLEERPSTSNASSKPLFYCRNTQMSIVRNITEAYELNAKRRKTDNGASNFSQVSTGKRPSLKLMKMMKEYKVGIRLDPDTAHPCLILSEANTNVQNKGEDHPRPKNVKRFTYHRCVLGRDGFIGGKYYWEVDVLKKGGGWCVGIAGESVKRINRIIQSPEEAIWAVGQWDGDIAFTTPPIPLPLLAKCRTLAMYLDYDAGQLSFFDAHTSERLYIFEHRFSQKIFPYFNLRNKAELCLKDL